MKLTEKLLKEEIEKVMNEAEPRAKFRNYDTSGVDAVEDYEEQERQKAQDAADMKAAKNMRTDSAIGQFKDNVRLNDKKMKDVLLAKLRKMHNEERATLIAAEQFGDINDQGPGYAERVLQNAINGDYTTEKFKPVIGNKKIMTAYKANPKHKDMLKNELFILVNSGKLHGFMNDKSQQQNWKSSIESLVANKLIPVLLKDPKSKGFFSKMKSKFFGESITLSSDDIRKMIQEELINISKGK